MRKKLHNMIESRSACCVLVYGYIGEYEDVRPACFIKDLIEAENTGKKIDVRINSRGGDVYGGIAMFNALRESKADITIYIDGIAASMGSVIAACEKPVQMSSIARLMIHSVSGGTYGGKEELLNYIKEMEAVETTLISIYARKIGKTEEEIRNTYFDGKDHWLTAKEALDLGFVDGIYDVDPVPAGSTPEQIYDIYQNRLYDIHQNDNEMIETFKKRKRFSACTSDEDVLREVEKLEAEAAKVLELEKSKSDLEAANKALREENEGYNAKEKEVQEASDKKLLDDAQKSGKIGSLDVPVYRAALNGADRAQTLAAIEALPAKRRVMDAIDKADGGGAVSAWDERMKEIANRKK